MQSREGQFESLMTRP
nr:unnamed protein product [Callosobruchus chinensis]